MAPALRRAHNHLLFARQHLLERLQVEPQFIRSGSPAEGGLVLYEASGVARRPVLAAPAVGVGIAHSRLGVAASQRYLLVTVAFGLIDEAVLLFVRARDVAERVHDFERR